MHCLVTGGSGTIGRALLPVLAEHGHGLRVQHCRGSAPSLSFAKLDVQACDFSEGKVGLNLEGVDLVYHLAGIAHQRADVQTYQYVNVDASLALAEQAQAAGVGRFVFVSSVKALAAQYDAQGALLSVYEASDPYAQSKALAEFGLQEICRGSELELVIVRPALVYSEEALGHLRWLRRWTSLHLPVPPAGGGRSMIALDDLLSLLALLAVAPLPLPSLLTVTDNQSYSTRRLHAAFCAALGRRPWLPTPPEFVWRKLCKLWDLLRRDEVGRTWARMTADECYRSTGLDDLDFRPSLDFETSLGVGIDAA